MAFRMRRAKQRDDLIVDRVTGAFNRRYLDQVIASGFDLSGEPTATLLIEVDDFERFVDMKRNGSTDQILERVSWVVMATVRTTDVVYRHHESAFCALLPATSDVDACAVADRIRLNVEKMPLLVDRGVTVSIGVATGSSTDLAATIRRATKALDTGAAVGPNRVFAAGDSRADFQSPVRTESFAPAELSPQVSAELATAFAASDRGEDDESSKTPVLAPDASVPLTPPSL
jgi:diguanylate cyclase (GGDEF)-like protein